ncbi:MAG: thioredoxin domain-containing protein [Candidatus Pacebacteria bacterium]|nr:thioredoxin domain-containing protein [Candidatus Paceibacterota bacterium]
MQKYTRGNYATPASIVIAGVLIAGALFFALGNQAPISGGQPVQQQPTAIDTTDQIRPLSNEDHRKGNPNAKVTIVEYSDFECPFCKRFHDTMNQVLEDRDDIAWVFRHFPLDQLHPRNARRVAVASECVNELGGEDAFWIFTDGFFEVTPSNDRTDISTVIPNLVAKAGVNETAFNTCVASGKYDQHVQDDVDDAIATGGQGTPWSVIFGENGDTLPLSGAQPVGAVMQLVEIMLKSQ